MKAFVVIALLVAAAYADNNENNENNEKTKRSVPVGGIPYPWTVGIGGVQTPVGVGQVPVGSVGQQPISGLQYHHIQQPVQGFQGFQGYQGQVGSLPVVPQVHGLLPYYHQLFGQYPYFGQQFPFYGLGQQVPFYGQQLQYPFFGGLPYSGIYGQQYPLGGFLGQLPLGGALGHQLPLGGIFPWSQISSLPQQSGFYLPFHYYFYYQKENILPPHPVTKAFIKYLESHLELYKKYYVEAESLVTYFRQHVVDDVAVPQKPIKV